MVDPAVQDDLDDSILGPEYQFIKASSQRGRDKLADIYGYTYVFKRESKAGVITWR